ncbi:hypothetical protein [Leisingera sp. ANG-M1]|uniref:hypothetical protein n=1 Tax=Leisingera sp. ANG-M1 TaxID=1577895 RepID=UPI00057DCB75|nr:hypothetical protein [Leisingera sp. ANG-M1]
MADAVKLGINLNAEKGEVMDTFRLLADEGITMIAVVHEVPFFPRGHRPGGILPAGGLHENGSAEELTSYSPLPRTQEFRSKIL